MTFLEFSALTRDSSDNACEDAIHCRLYHCNGIIPLSSLFVFVWAVPVMKWPLPQASYTVADGSPSPDRYRWTRASAMVAPTSVACDCSNCNNDELSSLSCCSDDILDSAVSSWWFKSCGREIIIKLLLHVHTIVPWSLLLLPRALSLTQCPLQSTLIIITITTHNITFTECFSDVICSLHSWLTIRANNYHSTHCMCTVHQHT